MRAVRFDVSVPGFLLTKTLGRVGEWAVTGGPSGLSLVDVPAPQLVGPRWVRLKVLACGVCGSDVSAVWMAQSMRLEPFSSFPAVLGHEILAEVAEVGPEVSRFEVGQRVVVDPFVGCVARERKPACQSCEDGLHATCGHTGDEGPIEVEGRPMAHGGIVGYHRDLPGGWSEEMVAHEDHVFAVPEGVPNRAAVLTEPLAISMHAVLQKPPVAGQQVLVIGSGPIAFSTIWALRAVGFEGTVVAQVKRAPEQALARTLGATEVVTPGDEANRALERTGSRAYQPQLGPAVYAGGGFDVVYDCVGNAVSVQQALGAVRPRGRVSLLGCAAELKKVDLSPLWSREIEVAGVVGYGREIWRGEARHTFEITLDALAERGIPHDAMVTHVLPLEQYRAGLSAAAHRRASGAIKVVLSPTGAL